MTAGPKSTSRPNRNPSTWSAGVRGGLVGDDYHGGADDFFLGGLPVGRAHATGVRVRVSAGGKITRRGHKLLVDGVVVDYRAKWMRGVQASRTPCDFRAVPCIPRRAQGPIAAVD